MIDLEFRSQATPTEKCQAPAASGMLAITSFIIQCLNWEAGKPKELDQSSVRVARDPPRSDAIHRERKIWA